MLHSYKVQLNFKSNVSLKLLCAINESFEKAEYLVRRYKLKNKSLKFDLGQMAY